MRDYVTDIHYQYRKVKASVILCTYPNCGFPCVDDSATTDVKIQPTDQLVTRFTQHLFKHSIELSNEFKDKIQTMILYFRTNKKIPYLDPFLYVSYDDIIKNRYDGNIIIDPDNYVGENEEQEDEDEGLESWEH